MTKTKAHVLVTRPDPQGRVLTNQLLEQAFDATFAPLFSYQSTSLDNQTPCADIFIFVSRAAVEFAHEQIPLSCWNGKLFIGVGKATAQCIEACGVKAISPELQNSEGILSLPQLTQVAEQKIVIVRGDEGRELLYQALSARQANVSYLQSYSRLWQTFPKQIANQWQAQGINFIICTSVAMLEKMAKLLISTDNYWQESCTWVVASPRIYQKAKQLALKNIVLANGASNHDLLSACQNGSNL